MFVEAERSGLVQIVLEADKISHRGHCVLQNDVHPATMDLTDHTSPGRDVPEMLIQQGEIERTEAVSRPRLVDERTAAYVERLHVFVQVRVQSKSRVSRPKQKNQHRTFIPIPCK